jgi:hypothetical protein
MGAFFVDAMIQPVNLNKQRYATIISGEADTVAVTLS